MHVCLSVVCLCDEIIIRPEEYYRLWCVVVCDLENSRMRSWPALGFSTTEEKKVVKFGYNYIISIIILIIISIIPDLLDQGVGV